jgi:hypothetical protein
MDKTKVEEKKGRVLTTAIIDKIHIIYIVKAHNMFLKLLLHECLYGNKPL